MFIIKLEQNILEKKLKEWNINKQILKKFVIFTDDKTIDFENNFYIIILNVIKHFYINSIKFNFN